MTRPLTYVFFAAALVAVGLGSYRAGLVRGGASATEATGSVLASVQAELALNKLLRLRELEADLSRGCAKEVLAKVRFDIDSEMYVLASLYRERKGTWAMENVLKREPTLAAQLEGFKQPSGGSWKEPKCPA